MTTKVTVEDLKSELDNLRHNIDMALADHEKRINGCHDMIAEVAIQTTKALEAIGDLMERFPVGETKVIITS